MSVKLPLPTKKEGQNMTNVTIIGASGSLGRAATQTLLNETTVNLTLMSRSIRSNQDPRVTTIAASVFDKDALENAVRDADLVFVALSGDLPAMVKDIIAAMDATARKRIIFIASYGIYGELAGQNGQVQAVLRPYRQAADILENSDLDYTILRPGWFDNSSDTSYELIPKGEAIYGNDISRKAIADFVKEVAENPSSHVKANYGMVR